jgi:hypothetical protein
METKQSMKEIRLSFIVALAWFAFFACNKNDQLLAPEKSDLNPTSILQKSEGEDRTTICQRDKNEIGSSTALIGPAGGVLMRAQHQLVIPAGALTNTVKITFSMVPSPYLECELKPYGLKFNKPVNLILSYNGVCDGNLDELALKVAYYNPQTQLGALIPKAIDTKLNTVTVDIERFAFSASNVTRYALLRR